MAARVELDIRGMHCASCVSVVEDALRASPGVREAAVNLTTEHATIELDEDAGDPGELLAAVRGAGYDAEISGRDAATAAEERRQTRKTLLGSLRRRLLIGLVLGLPVIALHWIHGWVAQTTGIPMLGVWVLQGALTAGVLAVAAGGMLRGALKAVLALRGDMDLLVSLGAMTAFGAGILGIVLGDPALLTFDAAVMITLFVGLGKYFELRSRGEAAAALEALLTRLPQEATRIVDGQAERVALSAIVVGDTVRVAAGETVPVDGVVRDGEAAVDEALLTGEAEPIAKGADATVYGGTIVVDGRIDYEATRVGRDSAVMQIARRVEDAQTTKPKWQRLADRAAAVFVPVVILLALLTLLGWLWVGDASVIVALKRTIAVLVIACPCAMGLAAPTAVLVGTSTAGQHGILVRDAEALEAAGSVELVYFDKTGTLTAGKPRVVQIITTEPAGEEEVLGWAAAVAANSRHPLSQAIVAEAERRGIEVSDIRRFRAWTGRGLRGELEGVQILVGSANWLSAQGVEMRSLEGAMEAAAGKGQSVVGVSRDGTLVGAVALEDSLREGAGEMVAALHKLGLELRILSGDRKAAVARVASQLGMDGYESELMPDDKLSVIRESGRGGRTVAMVGDGVNDGPALAAASVGIAVGTGTDVAREAASICLVSDRPEQIAEAIVLSRRSTRVMKQNLFWAVAYNVVMLPVAMFTPIPPGIAAAAMMASSLSVVGNSLRLRGTGAVGSRSEGPHRPVASRV